MPFYLTLGTWTEKGRREAASLPARIDQAREFFTADAGVSVIGSYLTVGRYDEAWFVESPDEEAIARWLMFVAGRGFITTETLRCFTTDEIRDLL